MTESLTATETFGPSREIYERLAAATPGERAEIVLRLIAAHPLGRLELPVLEGRPAVLDDVDLSRVWLEGRLVRTSGVARWWDAQSGGLRLEDADLRGASLRKANLQGAQLSRARLQGASLGGANLGGAMLDRADLSRADLAGANLQGASLGETDLQGSMMEEADLRDAVLRFAKLREAVLEDADLTKADLWGADLREAILTNAVLRGARLEEADLSAADLSGAGLQEAVLRQAKLPGARLIGADLRGALLGGADLSGAVLKDARLQEVELSQCVLTHIHLNGVRLDGARFQQTQLGGAIGEELAGECEQARRGYLALERAFGELGDPDAVSWAYRRRRRMQKCESLNQARIARTENRRRDAAMAYLRFAGDQFAEWICDYGESIPRVLASLLVLYVVFTILYGVTGSVMREVDGPAGSVRVTTHHPVDLAIFSLLAMTTGSIGIRLLPTHDLSLTLVGFHLFLGIALIGLLGFVLGNRIRR